MGKVFHVRTMEACRMSRGLAPLIFGLGTGWKLVVSFTPWPLYTWRNGFWYPLIEGYLKTVVM